MPRYFILDTPVPALGPGTALSIQRVNISAVDNQAEDVEIAVVDASGAVLSSAKYSLSASDLSAAEKQVARDFFDAILNAVARKRGETGTVGNDPSGV